MPRTTTTAVVSTIVSLLLGASAAHAEQPAAEPASEAAPGGDAAGPPSEARPEAPAEAGGDSAPDGEVEVLVTTGSRMRTAIVDSPADVRTIDEERLSMPGTNTVFDAATDISGVSLNLRQEGTGFADMEVRGLTGNATSGGHTLVLIDGIPQRRLSFGGPYMGALPYDAITRLEIAKGAAAALYGRNALTAALQLFSDPGSHTPRSTFVVEYEAPIGRRRTSARVGAPLSIGHGEGGTFSLTGSLVDTEGWQPRSAVTRGDLYLHVELPLTARDRLSIFGGYFSTRQDTAAPVLLTDEGERLPGIERDANLAVPELNELNLVEQRAGLRYTRDWSRVASSKLTLSYWSGLTDSQVGRPSDRPVEGTTTSRLARDALSDEQHVFTELEVYGEYTATEDITGSYSVGASAEWLEYIRTQRNVTTAELLDATGGYGGGIPVDYVTGEGPSSSEWRYSDRTRRDTTENVFGAFVRKQLRLWDRLTVEGGVRFDRFERTQVLPATDEEATTDGQALSPSAGINVALWKGESGRLHAFGNWGQGFSPVFRAVANTEFADVEPERSTSIDAGLKARLLDDRLDLGAAVYQLDRNDLVQYDASIERQRNAGDWRIRGVELDARFEVVTGLRLLAAVALRDPVVVVDIANPETEGNDVTGVAKLALTAGLDWRSDFGLGVGTRLRHVGERAGNTQNTFVLPAYTLWSAHVSYDVTPWLTAAVFGRNLLDADYFPSVFNGVARGSGFAGRPRTYGLTLRAEL